MKEVNKCRSEMQCYEIERYLRVIHVAILIRKYPKHFEGIEFYSEF